MPYLGSPRVLDYQIGDTITITFLEEDPENFKIGETFELIIENTGYNPPHQEYRYYYDFGPKGFECIFLKEDGYWGTVYKYTSTIGEWNDWFKIQVAKISK